MNVKLLAPAQHELDEAMAWYAAQAPGLGDAFLVETLKTITLITRYPQAWHPLSPQTRRCRLSRFPYSVIYSLDGDDLLVIAICHQHRKPGYWRDRMQTT
ncbi:MAG: type II toxin-antitoxin system RelE/ParE family toxin [Burkholderiaceae bacterium]|nr:type II toxin-antitoxin system RelE/ParE family toxin [Burkholderiaceae bacterium]